MQIKWKLWQTLFSDPIIFTKTKKLILISKCDAHRLIIFHSCYSPFLVIDRDGYNYIEPANSLQLPSECRCECPATLPPPPKPTTTKTTTTKTTRPPLPNNNYLPPINFEKSPSDNKITKAPFKGPTYLPPTRKPVFRDTTTTPKIPRRSFTYGTYSIPKYTFRWVCQSIPNFNDFQLSIHSYTYPTSVPTRSRTYKEKNTQTYTTTEGYERRVEDFDIRNQLFG